MAIARCKQCGRPSGRNVKSRYANQPHFPAGHPASGVVCGKPNCENDALIWLNLDEERAYQDGKRIFGIHTHTAKIRVQ